MLRDNLKSKILSNDLQEYRRITSLWDELYDICYAVLSVEYRNKNAQQFT